MRHAILTVVLSGCIVASAIDLHLAPAGKDANPGTNDKPLATLAGARDAIRKLKQAGPLREAITVHFLMR